MAICQGRASAGSTRPVWLDRHRHHHGRQTSLGGTLRMRGVLPVVLLLKSEAMGVEGVKTRPVCQDTAACHSSRTMLAHTKKVWCWSKANNAALKEAIKDANWDEFYEATSVNIAWQRWKSILLPLAENHIPQRTSSSTTPPKPWITAEIRAQIREKHRLYRRYKKKRCPEAWDKYRQVRNAVASHLKKAKSLFVLNRLADASSHANDLPGNPEKSNCKRPRLQIMLQSLLKQKPVDIPDLCDPSQTLPKATTDLGKAELLNQFFISQSRQSASPGAVPPIRTPRSPLVLDRFQVSYEQVANGLRTINTRKAPGADGIPPKLLQMVAQEVTPTVHPLV